MKCSFHSFYLLSPHVYLFFLCNPATFHYVGNAEPLLSFSWCFHCKICFPRGRLAQQFWFLRCGTDTLTVHSLAFYKHLNLFVHFDLKHTKIKAKIQPVSHSWDNTTEKNNFKVYNCGFLFFSWFNPVFKNVFLKFLRL